MLMDFLKMDVYMFMDFEKKKSALTAKSVYVQSQVLLCWT